MLKVTTIIDNDGNVVSATTERIPEIHIPQHGLQRTITPPPDISLPEQAQEDMRKRLGVHHSLDHPTWTRLIDQTQKTQNPQ